MIFLDKQNIIQITYYKKLLKVLGSLSHLFSDTEVPYLNYRISENLFCKSFEAKNLSRFDVSVDASKNEIGIGLKTFLEANSQSWQKVAEFNKERNLYINKTATEIINIVSRLRNTRIDTTKRIYKLNNLIYHCIVRKIGQMRVYEINMDFVQEDSITKIEANKNTIKFTDGLNEYSFNISKSTLYKKFITPQASQDLIEIDIQILSNPFDILENLLEGEIDSHDLIFESIKNEQEHILLPLYSDKTKKVQEKSGLNQWNAGGRKRNPDEIYIPIPKFIHQEFPNFFPERDKAFNLELPDGLIMNAKICQDGGKALMSNPNKALGKWLLRDILNLKENELLTIDKLREIGLDSVVIYKHSPDNYSINFTKTSSFNEFKSLIN